MAEPTDSLIPYEYPEVVSSFLTDTGLVSVFAGEVGSEDARLGAILSSISSMFSLNEPSIGSDTITELRGIARDTQLANIIRERALYRLYLIVRGTRTEHGVAVPLWYGLDDDMGNPLLNQEDFIGWFTSKSGLSRASTFRRIRVYQRLEAFGITGKEAWLRVLQMPGITQELLKELATWERNKCVGIHKDVAIRMAEYVLPSQRDTLEQVYIDDRPVSEIMEAFTPVVHALFQDIKDYPSAKEALTHIRLDILGQAVVTYRWIPDEEVIGIRAKVPVIENGELVDERVVETVLFLDDPEPSQAILEDLFKRLPIGNKHDLPTWG